MFEQHCRTASALLALPWSMSSPNAVPAHVQSRPEWHTAPAKLSFFLSFFLFFLFLMSSFSPSFFLCKVGGMSHKWVCLSCSFTAIAGFVTCCAFTACFDSFAHIQAIAEAIAKERAATAAMLQAAAAAQQPALQSRATNSFDSRGPAHLSRPRHQQQQQQQQVATDQDMPFARSRLGNPRPQQTLLGSSQDVSSSNAAAPAGHAAPRFATRQTNGHAHESIPFPLAAGGLTASQSSDDLREGFRRAVSAVPEDSRLPHARRDDLLSCSINHVLPHVASWGNLSNHSSSSNSGLHENTSRGLPTFEPISTPAGLFNSSGTASGDKGSFPSYLASIWSSDAKSGSLSGSPNSHFEQPSLLNNHH